MMEWGEATYFCSWQGYDSTTSHCFFVSVSVCVDAQPAVRR